LDAFKDIIFKDADGTDLTSIKAFFVESNTIYNNDGDLVSTSIYNMLMKEKLKKQVAIERSKMSIEESKSKSDYAVWRKDKKRISKEAKGLPPNSKTPV